MTSRKNGSGKRKGRGVSDSVGWPSQENGVWIYGAFAGFFSRENHITWQVMETFSDDPNVARLQLGYNTKLFVLWRCEGLVHFVSNNKYNALCST